MRDAEMRDAEMRDAEMRDAEMSDADAPDISGGRLGVAVHAARAASAAPVDRARRQTDPHRRWLRCAGADLYVFDALREHFAYTRLDPARFGHTATDFVGRDVLLAGGSGVSAVRSDPVAFTFKETGTLAAARVGGEAFRMANGRWLPRRQRGQRSRTHFRTIRSCDG